MGDRRTQRTRDFIEQAFLELIDDTPLEQITVTAVTRRANVGRGTFYLHYQDIYDLYDQIMARATHDLLQLFDQTYPVAAFKADEFTDLAQRLITYVGEHRQVFEMLLRSQRGREVLQPAKRAFIIRVLKKERLSLDDPAEAVAVSFSVSGIIGVITDWLSGEFEIGTDQLIGVISELIAAL